MVVRPEVLAPAGDEASMRAAIRSGADAVYFGIRGHNARARAANFAIEDLPRVMQELHSWGVKGYVPMNVLAFDHELHDVERALRACADAGVDAIIVQDLGVAALAKAVAPGLPIHASTQMTCTDAASVAFAESMGASRIVLAREISLDEIALIRQQTSAELEVFVHGALCVSYSGQCLTSEAIGGRSANRGACAQACRLPYDLVVDGVVRELGDVAYLLSPEDLEAAALVPKLAALDVHCLKIEGRLKGPEYVAAATRLYRAAVDAIDDPAVAPTSEQRRAAMLTFSRGSSTGFLLGSDHQRRVDGKTCDHRGVQAGVVSDVRRERTRQLITLTLESPLKRGDGVIVEGGRAGSRERGGRVWDVDVDGVSVEAGNVGQQVRLWLGPDVDVGDVQVGRRVFHNDDPALDKALLTQIEREPVREWLDVVVAGDIGTPFIIDAKSARGLVARVVGDGVVEAARNRPIDQATLEDKLGRLGDSPYRLRSLNNALPDGVTLPLSAMNRARRQLVEALAAAAVKQRATSTAASAETLLAKLDLSTLPTPPPGLFVLCRTEDQAHAALDAGADGVWLDFLALTGVSRAVDGLRKRPGARAFVGVAPPRIRKPGEEKITKFLAGLDVDGTLVRGLGPLHELSLEEKPALGFVAEASLLRGGRGNFPADQLATATTKPAGVFVGDFSLNVSNRLTVREVMARGLGAFTPSFDLDEDQLEALLATDAGRLAEIVVHQPMPLFHTEHCVFAALLSDGKGHDFRTCGRPCESHTVALRDRAGLTHPVEADVGCRNTVFHERAQSAASLVGAAKRSGVGRYRIELVKEAPEAVKELVAAYRALLAGEASAKATLKRLKTAAGYGVVKGSLRVLDQDAA